MSASVPSSGVKPAVSDTALKVMVVDDSVVIRGLMSRWLAEEPGMRVVAAHRTGRDAVNDVLASDPDVVVLDIEMPDLDGISALPQLLAKKPDLVIIMASTLTRRNAEISMKAMSLGAADYIPKPETNRDVSTSQDFRRELIYKVRSLGTRRRKSVSPASPVLRPASPAAPVRSAAGHPTTGFALRSFSPTPPRILVIGSSTGGPQALQLVVKGLGGVIDRIPVLVVQHMPATFTTILAEHLSKASGRPAHEAVQGEAIKPGQIVVAPGGKHMLISKSGTGAVLALDDGPPVNFCKPAVDPMFFSAAQSFGAATLALVLTGMGSDGAKGAVDIASAGGSVIAQDEPTSVVWGMPGATAQSGVCSAVLPLDQIAPRIQRLLSGDRS